MNSMNFIGLDIHKKSISCCVRQADSTIIQESTIAATRHALDEWMRQLPQPWMAGMEATLFTGWIYDHLGSGGALVKVAHPAMLQAIAAGKKKNDRLDARKIADLLRCDYFPECHMAPREIRDRRLLLPQSAGETGSANEEQSERAADGSGCAVQPAEGASEEVLC